jgi:hypothetical protein
MLACINPRPRIPNTYHMDVGWWSYFGSGHNKGVHDGARAVLKQEIKK